MKILVLNGSPRPGGDTAAMVKTFQEEAERRGHQVVVFPVCRMNIRGCLACEYCHGKGQGFFQKILSVTNAPHESVLSSLFSGTANSMSDMQYEQIGRAHV